MFKTRKRRKAEDEIRRRETEILEQMAQEDFKLADEMNQRLDRMIRGDIKNEAVVNLLRFFEEHKNQEEA